MKFRFDNDGNYVTIIKVSRGYDFNKELDVVGFVQGIDYAFRELSSNSLELICLNPRVKEYLKK